MASLQQQTKLYLESVFGVSVQSDPIRLKLPYHVQDAYRILQIRLNLGDAGITMLLLQATGDQYPGAVALGKHIAQVHNVTDEVVVYVTKSLTTPERRSLISHHINFIQPGYQMFIPALALDLREKVRQRRVEETVSALLPAAQAMLLDRLHEGWSEDTTFSSHAIMGDLKYSRVTLAKVLDQFLTLKLLRPAQGGGSSNLHAFEGPPAEVFKRARRCMRTPVQRRVAINATLPLGDGVFLAGEAALAHYSLLAEPSQPIYGMTRKRFADMLASQALQVSESVDETAAWVEIWSYNNLQNNSDLADRASLLLSLEDSPDERIQIALDDLKEQVEWWVSEG